MKFKYLSLVFFLLILFADIYAVSAQCSLCTKTASQLGEKPALGMNQGILYLMLTPFLIMGFIAYRWWKSNRNAE